MRRSREEEQERRRQAFRLAYLARVQRGAGCLTALVTALEGGTMHTSRLWALEQRIARLTAQVNLDVMAASGRVEETDARQRLGPCRPVVVLRRAS